MRKIDAVLLSALILYDYSAQSLVDSDTISFGHSFINNGFHDNKLTDPDFTFTPEFNNEEATVVRGVKHLNVVPPSKTGDKNISYYELAKINPTTAAQVTAALNEVAAVENAANTTDINESATSNIEAYTATVSAAEEKVALNEAAYATNEALNTAKIAERVADAADAATFDNDNDGTFDVEDKCPGVAGVARFEGCPVPDSDIDGINDEEDRCPLEKGSADNFGCPVSIIDSVLTNETAEENMLSDKKENVEYSFVINFIADSKVLSNEDFNVVLQLTDILVRKPNAKVEIEAEAIDNAASFVAPAERLSNYFRDLGVNKNQIIINAATGKKSNDGEGNGKVAMRLAL